MLFYPRKLNITITAVIMIALLYLPARAYSNPEGPEAPQVSQEAVNNQLKINHWTLSNSTDEQIRIDTAMELLENALPAARQILLDALNSTDNAAATSSVCKAINKYRSSSNLIPRREEFIQPLMNILKSQNSEIARLAAQATLIFNYREIKNHLDQIIKDSESADTAKRNAVYALQIRPDRETVLQLIDMLNSDDAVISSAAVGALQEWLPIGDDKQRWQKIRRDIERGRLDIVRERVLSQQDKVRRLNEDVLKWQKKYLTSLDNIYLAMADDNVRAKFVAENLTFEQTSVKLWAIEKINMWQKSGKLLPLDVLQKPLASLVSDSDPAVRIASVKLLGLLTNINSASALFEQLQTETLGDVKTEILIALGHVCNFALSPGSEVQINPQVRIETLKTAVEFFKDSNPVISAEVIRNLLLQNGLEMSEVKPYFEFIAGNYSKAEDDQVRIRLIEEMERLCGGDSFYRATAGEVFREIFLAALNDKNNLVAAPAVSGLLKIDQAGAFEILKSQGFTGHSSSKIRTELISAAGQIGTAQDLEWLAALADNAETDVERQRAADAMMNIFQYCQTDVLISWAQKLYDGGKSQNDELLLAKARTLFETAEKKAEAQQDVNSLVLLRRTLADSYAEALQFAAAAKYYGMLLQSATDVNERELLTANLLDMNIRGGQAESAKQLLANILLSNDIGEDKKVSKVLDKYFSENQNKERTAKMFRAIVSIQLAEANKYPLWTGQIAKWRGMLKILPAGPNAPLVAESNSIISK